MGSEESRFSTLLVEGKEEEAFTLWEENREFQAHFQPNVQIKSSPNRDTPLHCAVRFEMKKLCAEFLSNGAYPFSMNGNGETPLHIVCRSSRSSSRYSKRKAEFLKMLLDRIPTLENSEACHHKPPMVENSLTTSGKSGFFSLLLMKDKDGEKTPNGGVVTDSLVGLSGHHLGIQDRVRAQASCLSVLTGTRQNCVHAKFVFTPLGVRK